MAQDELSSGPPPGYGPVYGPPPGYGPGYGPPPGYGYPPPPGYPGAWRRPTNGMAVAALVTAFVIAPVGIGLGIAARKQIRQTGEEGDGLALAGIVVGSVITGIYVLMIVLMVAAFSAATSYAC